MSPTRFRHHRHRSSSRLPLTLAIPMASAVTLRRQLAPTVGQAEASTGVLIRTGSSSLSGGSHASGLILRRGAVDHVVDYSARFGVGAPLPPGVSMRIGSHRLFISSFPEAYPSEVCVFSSITDPLPTRGCQAALGGEDGRVCAAVMMAGTTASSNQDETAAARRARLAAEAEAGVGPNALRDVLYTPVNRGGDPNQIHESLERTRLALAATAERVLADERRLRAITREYNAAHAVRRGPVGPAAMADLRSRGREVGRQLSGAGQPTRPAQPTESAFVERPTYSTPDKNLRAAEQIAIELEDLEGDERHQQTRRMRELLAAAKEQQLVAQENPVARPEASRATVVPISVVSQRPNASRQNRQPAQSRHESRVKSNRHRFP